MRGVDGAFLEVRPEELYVSGFMGYAPDKEPLRRWMLLEVHIGALEKPDL